VLHPVLISPGPMAYLDPGTGSLLIQAALAAVLTAPFILRTRLLGLWRRVRGGQPGSRPNDQGSAR
jgi:hypothetical protein